MAKIISSYIKPPLTNFKSITLDTPLEDLNLNWRERDLPERERTKHVHRLHPYLGKFIPQLVEVFLRKYQPSSVYDPFCGSGTTLVEANALGINSIGCDISEFNCLLTRVKTQKYDLNLLRKEIYDIILKVSQLHRQTLFSKEINIELPNNLYLKRWFSEKALKELIYFNSLISNYTYQDALQIILSRAARSARLTTHFDLDFPKKPQTTPYFCYKHGRTCQPVNEAMKFLKRYSIDTLERIKEFSKIRTDARVDVIHDDSRKVKLPYDVDCVITSPPYVGLIDYHEQHRYAFELLGLENREDEEIGRASDGRSVEAQKSYIKGVNEVFLNTRNYLKKSGIMVIVIHDKNNLYKAENVGFKEECRIARHVNRRTGRRNGAFYEDVLIWRKI